MAKTQVNFRIDGDLLDKIKDAAQENDETYTQWIIV